MTTRDMLVTALIVFLVAVIFRFGMVTLFEVPPEANSVILMNLLIVVAPLLVVIYARTSGRTQAVLITLIVLVIFMVGFSVWVERGNPEGLDSLARSNSGTVLAFLKAITPPFLKNDTVNHHYNKACDDAIAKQRAEAEKENLRKYTDGGESEAEFVKQRQLINFRFQQVKQCDMDVMQNFPTMPGGNPDAPENQIKPAPKAVPKRKPVVRRRIPHCRIICRG